MNNWIFALLAMFSFSSLVNASELDVNDNKNIRVAVVGQVESPVASVVKAGDLVAPYIGGLKFTKFAEKKWFYLIRIKNVRTEGSDRVKLVRQEIQKVFFNEKDTFADLGLTSGDVIFIPSRW